MDRASYFASRFRRSAPVSCVSPNCLPSVFGRTAARAAVLVTLLFICALQAFGQTVPTRLCFCMYDTPQAEEVLNMNPVYRGVAISMDRGHSWKSAGWITNRSNDIAADPGDPSVLYLANDHGLLIGERSGESWRLITPWYIHTVLRIAVAGGSVWIATASGVYESTDRGASWTERSAGLPRLNGTYVSDLHASGDTLLAATADGAYRSTDRGLRWTSLGLKGQGVSMMVSAGASFLFLTDTSGIMRYRIDEGRWDRIPAPPGVSRIQTLAVVPGSGDLIIGTQNAGVLVFSNDGAKWTNHSGGLTNFNITALTFDRDDSRFVYAGAENGSFVSQDGGNTWKAFTLRFGYVGAIRIL
jgi:ligand-binding sensor domain-containing protein